MPASLLKQFFPLPREHREIDMHADLEIAATNVEEIHEFLIEDFATHQEAVLESIREQTAVQQEANSLLLHLNYSIGRTNQLLRDVHGVGRDTLSSLREGFHALAIQMLDQRAALARIVDTLRQPYEVQVQELLRRAEGALQLAIRSKGKPKEQRAHYEDAKRLLDAVLANPIGSTDYVAWLRKGHVIWKSEGRLPDAEDAFFHSARLSEEAANHYHIDAIRHLAHMQYLQGRYEEAYNSIQRAVRLPPDFNVLWDAARLASRTGRTKEARELLEKCITLRPEAARLVVGEKDFWE